MTLTAHIDFADPHDRSAPRLRQAFGAPREVLQAHQLQDVRAVLDAVHAAAQRGHWCVGHVRYEAAAAFDAALQTHAADGPLAWFAVYDAPLPWPADGSADAADPAAQVEWTGGPDRAGFDAAIAHIQQAISAGELYQVNYTAPLTGSLRQGSAAALFAALQRAQPGGYAAHMAAGPEQVLSVSPELFFDWHDAPGGGRILARPMKGTAARGATPADDAAQAAHLRASPKERAENVMIVDLLRNDLSRIAQPHSVRVPALFHTEGLPTVWQMTSDVQARTRAGIRLSDVFAALFPCGSVTGAPKVRAMQMIRALESAPRGVYCGAVGVVRPAGVAGPDGLCSVAATFNVPIRTVVLRAGADGATTATCGIGSGITSGATADAEWSEWRHKRAFVERASAPFDLLETLALVMASSATWPNTWRGCRARRRISMCRSTPLPCRLACRRWQATTPPVPGACACCCAPAASPTPRPLPCTPRPSRCACNWRAARCQRPMANSCATRPRAARTTPRWRPPRPVCSTPCCGTKRARSPKPRLATLPCCWTAAGLPPRWPAACCPAWAAPWPCARGA